MRSIINLLKRYMETCTFDTGDPDCQTVLDQLFWVYRDSHESDPPEIRDSFRELDALLRHLPLDDNSAAFNLCCSLCTAYEYKDFIDGFHYGVQLIMQLDKK